MSSHRATIEQSLARRYASEKRFRWYGLAAMALGLLFLGFLLLTTLGNAYTAIQQTYMAVDFDLTEEALGIDGPVDDKGPERASTTTVSSSRRCTQCFPEVSGRREQESTERAGQ